MTPTSTAPSSPITPARPGPADLAVRAGVMAAARTIAGEQPSPTPRGVLCPYCGGINALAGRCASCGGRFDPLSRQATQNHMGPWAIRDERNPHRPGCTYETLCRMIDSGSVTPDTVLRGPSTRQFWMLARQAPGVAHRLGVCHNCRQAVSKDAFSCPACEAPFTVDRDRQHLGVGPIRPLPGQGAPAVLALHAGPGGSPGPGPAGSPGKANGAGAAGAALPRVQAATRDGQDDPYAAASRAQATAAGWRRAADTERTRGLIALVLAALVVISTLVYAGMIASNQTQPAESGGVLSSDAG